MQERFDRGMAEAIRAFVVRNRNSDGTYSLDPKIAPEALVSLIHEAVGDELSFYPEADQLVWHGTWASSYRHARWSREATPRPSWRSTG